MIIRHDRRTKWKHLQSIKGIPVVAEYKYLGITMNDTGSFKPLHKELNRRLTSYKRQLSMCWATKLPHKIRHLTWQSLIYSRFSYSLALVASFNKKTEEFHTKLLYQSFKGLLQTKRNPNKEGLLRMVLGIFPSQFNTNL